MSIHTNRMSRITSISFTVLQNSHYLTESIASSYNLFLLNQSKQFLYASIYASSEQISSMFDVSDTITSYRKKVVMKISTFPACHELQILNK